MRLAPLALALAGLLAVSPAAASAVTEPAASDGCSVIIFWFGPPGTCPPFFEYCGGLIGVNYCGLAIPLASEA